MTVEPRALSEHAAIALDLLREVFLESSDPRLAEAIRHLRVAQAAAILDAAVDVIRKLE